MIDERIVTDAAPAELPGIIGDLARLHALALARLVSPQYVATPDTADDVLLDAAGVAAILKIEAKAVRRLAALRPYLRRLSPKVHRWSAAGVRRLAARRAV